MQGTRIGLLPESALGLIRRFFESPASEESVLGELSPLRTHAVQTENELPLSAIGEQDRLLVPEVFFNEDRLAFYELLCASNSLVPFFIVYDLLLLTDPHFFPVETPHVATSRYFRLLRTARNLGFISESAKESFRKRLLRRDICDGVAFPLGSDGLSSVRGKGRPAPNSQQFAVIGTIEPRKQHQLIVEALEECMESIPEFRLIFCGRMGWVAPRVRDMIHQVAHRTQKLELLENPSDEKVRDVVLSSRATIFLSAGEGFGLPPVESLWLGTPVIAAPGIPSLEKIGNQGIELVDPPTASNLRSATVRMLDDFHWERKMQEISQLDLPTWRSFAQNVADWVTS